MKELISNLEVLNRKAEKGGGDAQGHARRARSGNRGALLFHGTLYRGLRPARRRAVRFSDDPNLEEQAHLRLSQGIFGSIDFHHVEYCPIRCRQLYVHL